MEETHPAQQLLNRANRWYTRGDLWRATEIYLNLWGSAFWALDRDEEGVREIWPLRPDRVSILPDRKRHIRGFVYQGQSGPVPYTPEEVIWIRYFNPPGFRLWPLLDSRWIWAPMACGSTVIF